ncbi:MAG: glutamine amidotransferase-related protein [Collinsella aerofaciens]
MPDAYLSVIEALHHAGVFYDRHGRPAGRWREPRRAECPEVHDASGILVPGGFGKRALEGRSSQPVARSTNSYLGICLGMQVAVLSSPATSSALPAPAPRVRSGRPV